jgi:hypothetical protein
MRLANRWSSVLLSEAETGMGYQVVRLTLRDGRRFDGITIVDGIVTDLPPSVADGLTDDDIVEIVVTHSRDLPAVLRVRRVIVSPADLQSVLRQLHAAIPAGALSHASSAMAGHGACDIAGLPPADGPWPDLIHAEFRDRAGRRYRLSAETYHGAGGDWAPLDDDA